MNLQPGEPDSTKESPSLIFSDENSSLFYVLFEQAADPGFVLDGGKIIDCNTAAVKAMQCSTKDQLLGSQLFSWSPDTQHEGSGSAEKASEAIAIALNQGRHRFEWLHRRPDGDYFWVDVVATAVSFEKRQLLYVVSRDISNLKQIEIDRHHAEDKYRQTAERMQELQQKMRLLVEQAPLAIIEWNQKFEIQGWNPAAERIFGFTKQEAVGQLYRFIVPNSAEEQVDQVISALLTQQGGTWSSNVNVAKDGTELNCEWCNIPFIASNGEIISIISMTMDITARKRAEMRLRTSEQDLRTIFNGVYDALIVHDLDGRILDVNDRMLQMYGTTREEVCNFSIWNDCPNATGSDNPLAEVWNRVLAGETELLEWNSKFPNSHKSFDAEVILRKLSLNDREVVLASIRDISEAKREEAIRKAAEAELQRTRKFLESVLNALPVGVLARNIEESRFVLWNPAAEKILGFSAEQALGKTVSDLFSAEWAEFCNFTDQNQLSTEVVEISEASVESANGETRIFHLCKTSIPNETDIPQYYLVIVEEITERKLAEIAQRKSEEKFTKIFQSSPDPVVLSTLDDGKFLDVNESFCRVTGYGLTEVIGAHVFDLNFWVNPEDRTRMVRMLHNNEPVRDIETAFRIKSGEMMMGLTSAELLDLDGQSCILWVYKDITDRMQAEKELRQSEERFRSLVDNIPGAVCRAKCDAIWTIEFLSPIFEEICGYPLADFTDNRCRTLLDLPHPADALWVDQTIRKAIASHQPYALEYRICHADGSIRWVYESGQAIYDETGQPLWADGVFFDVTERKQAELALRQAKESAETALRELKQTQAHLIQAEKMSSLGQLVAGVAHEINNPVNFISGNISYISRYAQDLLKLVDLYRQYYPDANASIQSLIAEMDLDFVNSDLPKLLSSMRIGAERILQIVLSLRNFSRMDEAELKLVDIHEGIDSTLLILRSRLREHSEYSGIRIVKQYSTLPLVECYAGQLNQVFMNILANAIDSLDEYSRDLLPEEIQQNPPTIIIRTQMSDRNQIQICIIDNGFGMPEAVQKRIFEPFYTTKPVGKGTGLGLSISYQVVVDKHGGRLECISKPGRGTEFVIEIPVHSGG